MTRPNLTLVAVCRTTLESLQRKILLKFCAIFFEGSQPQGLSFSSVRSCCLVNQAYQIDSSSLGRSGSLKKEGFCFRLLNLVIVGYLKDGLLGNTIWSYDKTWRLSTSNEFEASATLSAAPWLSSALDGVSEPFKFIF